MYLNKGLGSFTQANKDTNKTLRLIYLMIQYWKLEAKGSQNVGYKEGVVQF